MVEQFAAPPVNPIVSIRPLSTSAPNRDAIQSPPLLAGLPGGTTLEGFVVNRDAANNPILRTPLGDLQMQSDVFVKTGSQMVIRVDATSDSRARIITIDGLPPQDYAAQNTRSLKQDTIMPTQLVQPPATAAPGTAPPPQQPLQAVLLSTLPPAAAANPLLLPLASTAIPASLMKLQAGAALKVMVLQADLPVQLLTPKNTPSAATAPQTQPQGQPTAANPMPPPARLPPVTPQQGAIQQTSMAAPEIARVAQQSVPTSASPPPTALPPAPLVVTQPGHVPVMMPGPAAGSPATPRPVVAEQRLPSETPVMKGIPAVVIGHERDGGNIVQTQFGMLKIFTPMPMPVHTKLAIDIQPETQAPTPLPGTAAPLAEEGGSLSSLSRGWPSLQEALHALSTDPVLAREGMQGVPHIGSKLASGLLFFLAAVKGGDLRQWMGARAVEALERKLPELAAKLKGDMAQLQQLMLHSPIDHWSGVMLPMLHGDQLEYARLYLRDEPDDGKKNEGKGKEQRFIVEIELSHLGEMQFDGFVRQTSPKKQFDLMIRTARPLDGTMANEIRGLFETALATTGYLGYLGFQQGSQHFVRPLAGEKNTPPDPHTILA